MQEIILAEEYQESVREKYGETGDDVDDSGPANEPKKTAISESRLGVSLNMFSCTAGFLQLEKRKMPFPLAKILKSKLSYILS